MLSVGIAGWGWAAQNLHIPGIMASSGLKLIAVCDPSPAIMPEPRIPWMGRLEELPWQRMDVLVVATPNDLHVELTEAALRAGVHVVCEKPLTLSTEAAQRVEALARHRHRCVLVHAPARFRDDVDMWLNGVKALGPLTRIELRWLRREGVPRPGSWFTSLQRAGGGALADLGPHLFDLLHHITKNRRLDVADVELKHNTAAIGDGWYGQKEEGAFDVETAARVCLSGKGLEAVVEVAWRAPVEDDHVILHAASEAGAAELKTVLGYSPARLRSKPCLTLTNGSACRTMELPIVDLDAVSVRAWRSYEASIRRGEAQDLVCAARWLEDAYQIGQEKR